MTVPIPEQGNVFLLHFIMLRWFVTPPLYVTIQFRLYLALIELNHFEALAPTPLRDSRYTLTLALMLLKANSFQS